MLATVEKIIEYERCTEFICCYEENVAELIINKLLTAVFVISVSLSKS